MKIEDINRDAFLFFKENYSNIKNDLRNNPNDYETYLIDYKDEDETLNRSLDKISKISPEMEKKLFDDMPRNFCIAINTVNNKYQYVSVCIDKNKEAQTIFSNQDKHQEGTINTLTKIYNIPIDEAKKKAREAVKIQSELIIFNLLKKLISKETRVASLSIPTNFKNPKSSISPFRIVTLKNITYKYDEIIRMPLEWKHSWKVMGHWRKTSGVGKDRDGNYILENKTWVVPFIKGKGELVEKIKIIK